VKLYLFDDTPAKEGEKHGVMGPCHYGTATVDAEYQAEMMAEEILADYRHVVRVECPDLGRVWKRP
jgi:hypothetical protein